MLNNGKGKRENKLRKNERVNNFIIFLTFDDVFADVACVGITKKIDSSGNMMFGFILILFLKKKFPFLSFFNQHVFLSMKWILLSSFTLQNILLFTSKIIR